MSVVTVTYDMAGELCPFCKSPTNADDHAHWTCGATKATDDTLDKSLMWFECFCRTNECQRRSLENMKATAYKAGEQIAKEKEKRILELVRGYR